MNKLRVVDKSLRRYGIHNPDKGKRNYHKRFSSFDNPIRSIMRVSQYLRDDIITELISTHSQLNS